jgi:ABC-2 type transport system permease protein
MITAVVSTALSIVREKERGTMEQVRMAPLDAASFVVGKTIPISSSRSPRRWGSSSSRCCCSACRCADRGWCCCSALSLFLVGALGLGLLISSIAETQQVAFQVALLVSFLPTLMLSGFVFPIASMPRALQLITYAVPARYFLVALRAIVLKGAGLSVYWVELVALSVFAVVVLGLASVRLHRQWV